MKKFTDFIVSHAYAVFGVMVVLTILSGLLIPKVKINHDIMQYMPDDSETSLGMDVMEEEFKNVETSSYSMMFENLPDSEKSEIKSYLESVNGVKDVKYDDSDDYNRVKDGKEYTLYTIDAKGKADEEDAANAYHEIHDHFANAELTDDDIAAIKADAKAETEAGSESAASKTARADELKAGEKRYTFYERGDIAADNGSVLSIAVIILAIGVAMVIITIMSESFIEPWLYLTSIMLAVVINKGTNIIFPNVSHITNAIVAVLQLALSMDYSIMLANRYRQERAHESDKYKAMKEALAYSFSSISASSVTTIVGLIVLIFMSFTIGRDMGLVLSKGVLLSLISIFTTLPAMLLLFDKPIMNSKKHAPNIKMDFAGKFAHAIRYAAMPVFIAVLIASYFLKGSIGIDFTATANDQIKDVFEENNQIAIIYNNDSESKITDLCHQYEGVEKVNQVLCYGNTINEPEKYDELAKKADDLGTKMDVDDYLIKTLYYHYYDPDESHQMTLSEFVNFIQQNIENDKNFEEDVTAETSSSVERLSNFVLANKMNDPKTIAELSKLLEMDEDDLRDVLVLYGARVEGSDLGRQTTDARMTLNDFAKFVKSDVLTNEKYADEVDASAREKIDQLEKFSTAANINRAMTASELAAFFGLSKSDVDELLFYHTYLATTDPSVKMSVDEFVNFVNSDSTIQSKLTNEQKASLKNLFSNNELMSIIKTNMTGRYTYSELVQSLTNILSATANTADQKVSAAQAEREKLAETKSALEKKKSELEPQKTELEAQKSELEENKKKLEAGIAQYKAAGAPESAYAELTSKLAAVNAGLEKINAGLLQINEGLAKINDNLPKVEGGIAQYDAGIKDGEAKSAALKAAASKVSGITDQIKQIYRVKQAEINSINDKLSPVGFATFILDHAGGTDLKGKISEADRSELDLAKFIMDSTNAGSAFNAAGLASKFDLDESQLRMLMSLYNITKVNTNPAISVKNLIGFVNSDVLTSDKYSARLTDAQKQDIHNVTAVMASAESNQLFTAKQIFSTLKPLDKNDALKSDTIDLLYMYHGSLTAYRDDWTMTLEGFVNYLADNILKDSRFDTKLDDAKRTEITDAKADIKEAKDMLIGKNYSRAILNTGLDAEGEGTFDFIKTLKDQLGQKNISYYVIGNSPMAYEMSQTFDGEMNFITILTMLSIFVVVAFTFRSVFISFILVLIIQAAVWITESILSFTGSNVYFIAIIVVQAILMGATIDYAILYTSYYLEHRSKGVAIKRSLIDSYNKSIRTIITSASVLVVVTAIVGLLDKGSAIAAKICITVSEGTLCSAILILLLLPAILAGCDKIIIRNKQVKADKGQSAAKNSLKK